MPECSFRLLDEKSWGPFAQYLLPEAADGLRSGEPAVIGLGAVLGRSACGAAAARVEDSSAELLSLFIDEGVRAQGLGGALLDTLCGACAGRGAQTLSADYVLAGDALAAMDALLRRRGALSPQTRSSVYRVETSRVRGLPILGPSFRSSFRPAEAVQPLDRLDAAQREALEGDPSIPAAVRLSSCLDRALPELCLCWVREGRPLAYVLGGESADGGLVLLAAVSLPGAPGRAFLDLLQALLNRFYYRAGGDYLFYTSALNPHTDALIRRLTRGCAAPYEEHVALLPLSDAQC